MDYVWNYPRPPLLAPEPRALKVVFAGEIIAQTQSGFRVCETAAPPTYYFPPQDVRRDLMRATEARSYCEFKGHAAYWDLTVGDATSAAAAWSYARPAAGYAPLAAHFAFYPGRVEACFVGDTLVSAQRGDFYGGWITPDVAGPFKGGPGTGNW